MFKNSVYVARNNDKSKGFLSKKFITKCNFCNMVVSVDNQNFDSIVNLSGKNIHCNFCIKNGYNENSDKILMFSFKSAISYYYHFLYLKNLMYYSSLNEIIRRHDSNYWKNPIINYNSESLVWFLDFKKVGDGERQCSLEYVSNCIKDICLSLEIKNCVGEDAEIEILDKTMKSINKFAKDFKRPLDKKLLCPSFSNSVSDIEYSFFDFSRNFLRKDIEFFQKNK